MKLIDASRNRIKRWRRVIADKKSQASITIIASTLAVIHALTDIITIDAVTLGLLGIAILPWVIEQFKAIEFGGVRLEFSNLGETFNRAGIPDEVNFSAERAHYSFETVKRENPLFALIGMRTEIETRISDIARYYGIETESVNLRKLIVLLERNNVFSVDEVSAMIELLGALNKVVHGKELERETVDWALSFGLRLLHSLDERLGRLSFDKLANEMEASDGAMVTEKAQELAYALVRAPEAFLIQMEAQTASLDKWLDSLDNVFTLFEAKNDLEVELYTAYYRRLKELMLNAIAPFLTSEKRKIAQRIKEKLSKVEITRIV